MEGILGLLLLAVLLVVFGTLAYGAISAAPWVPLGKNDVKRLVALTKLRPGLVLYDLGCGDGRVLEAAAGQGIRAEGFEVAIVPYALALLRKFFSSHGRLMKIHFKSFWNEPLNTADAVVCFLTPPAMRRLRQRVLSDLKPGAVFVTYAFALPDIEADNIDKPNEHLTSIYVYQAKKQG